MKISNRSEFPEALVKAIENDPYNKGDCDYSITGLLKPPRMTALELIHKDEIEDDAEDRLWSLYGQVAHLILERANNADLAEQRFFAEFDGKTVSGQIDTLEFLNGTLSDWKFTTSWGFKANQPPKPEWTAQLNMQRELLLQNKEKIEALLGIENLEINRLQIIGLLRDWSKMEAKRSKDYPQKQVARHTIEVWPREKTQSFIRLRIALHEAAKKELPLCDQSERWAKPDQFAVMKRGGKRAISLKFSEEDAIAHASQDPNYYVAIRPGESIRCENYCSVSQFCDQFKQNILTEEEEA